MLIRVWSHFIARVKSKSVRDRPRELMCQNETQRYDDGDNLRDREKERKGRFIKKLIKRRADLIKQEPFDEKKIYSRWPETLLTVFGARISAGRFIGDRS